MTYTTSHNIGAIIIIAIFIIGLCTIGFQLGKFCLKLFKITETKVKMEVLKRRLIKEKATLPISTDAFYPDVYQGMYSSDFAPFYPDDLYLKITERGKKISENKIMVEYFEKAEAYSNSTLVITEKGEIYRLYFEDIKDLENFAKNNKKLNEELKKQEENK
jgi:hypothetical protein